MKRIWISLVVLAAMGAVAAEKVVQPGVPALLEAVTGKKARVFLQSLEEGNLTFQPYNSTREMTVPAAKVKSLGFSLNKEELEHFRERGTISNDEISEIFGRENLGRAEKLELISKTIFGNIASAICRGEYTEVVAAIEPLMVDRSQYMVIENNLRDTFCMLMDVNRKLGEYDKVRRAANILIEADDPKMVQRGHVNLALVAIDGGDLPVAEGIRSEITSEAAGLYLQACIEQAQQRPEDGIKTIRRNILDHANDVEWLGPSELLCAYLYLDMAGVSNSVISTNSALNTARQVKNMYGGTPVAADAEKLWESLGGPANQAAEEMEAAEREIARKAAKEKRAAERKKRKAEAKAKKAAKAAAQAGSEAGTNVTTTTEMESE